MQLFIESYQLLSQGGWVTIPLLMVSAMLFYTISYRWLALRRGFSGHVRNLVTKIQVSTGQELRGLLPDAAKLLLRCTGIDRKHRRQQMDEVILVLNNELIRHRQVLHTLVIIAPLMGLLGTVIGMIETFDSLGEMTLYTQTGGIAGGISQALITTQIGLIIAVPGLFFDRFLMNREEKLRDEILQIKEIICQQS